MSYDILKTIKRTV